MLSKTLKLFQKQLNFTHFYSTPKFFFASGSSSSSSGPSQTLKRQIEKDYYAILNIPSTATPEQIKEAYRVQVKKYHPDVKPSQEEMGRVDYEPDVEKFRAVTEAYAVLSTKEARINYDLQRRKRGSYEHIASLKTQDKGDLQRDKLGEIPREKPSSGSYAEKRAKALQIEREKFNVNHLGYYKGGIPQKGLGNIRGQSLSAPGIYHNPQTHNELEHLHQDTKLVNREDANAFTNWMRSDQEEYQRAYPYYPVYYDKKFEFTRQRNFYGLMLLGTAASVYLYKKFYIEAARLQRTARHEENITSHPSHHFSNRGGIVLEKQFMGFEKYFRNNQDMMSWYHKVYPEMFAHAAAEEQ